MIDNHLRVVRGNGEPVRRSGSSFGLTSRACVTADELPSAKDLAARARCMEAEWRGREAGLALVTSPAVVTLLALAAGLAMLAVAAWRLSPHIAVRLATVITAAVIWLVVVVCKLIAACRTTSAQHRQDAYVELRAALAKVPLDASDAGHTGRFDAVRRVR